MKLTVVGTGYVGAVAASALAWIGHDVAGLDVDPRRVAQLSGGQVPLYEPGLDELLTEALGSGRLTFTVDPEEALPGAEIIVVCVGTPEHDGGAPDLSAIEGVARAVAALGDDGAVLACKSTVPVGTASRLRRITLERSIEVVASPEFLREGRAVEDFLHPDRIVLGGELAARHVVAAAFRPIIEQSFRGGWPEARPELFLTDATAAEMAKYASNAFLATKISFANEIAALCERVGADVREVLPAVGADPRIGASFLGPGLGWGGSCLPKDVGGLIATGRELGTPTPLLEAARDVNDDRVEHIVGRLRRHLGELEGARIAVLGLTFKPETDDLRSSPPLRLIRRLRDEGAEIRAHDPVTKEAPEGVRLAVAPEEAAADADAVVVATDWPEYAALDLDAVARRMRGDLVFDARNCVRTTPPRGLRMAGVGWG